MEILMLVIKWLVPILCSAILGVFVKIYKDNKALKSAMLSLVRSQIVGKVEQYQGMGFLPEYARYCLEDLFKQYKALGGNHGIEKLVEQCFELPLNEKEN